MDSRDSGREGKSTIKLVREIRPIEGDRGAPRAAATGGGIGWKTLAAFALVIAAGVAVFALLPRGIQNHKPSTDPASEPSPMDPAMVENAPRDLEELALEKTRAEELHSRATRKRDELESKNVSRWGGEEYRRASALLASAEGKMSSRAYREAAGELERLLDRLDGIDARRRALFSEAVESGSRFLADGRSAEAREKYQAALDVAPGDSRAASGLERAGNLDRVLALVAAGEDRERGGDLEGARALYREAASLDPLFKAAGTALARIDAEAAERAFQTAMTDALAALDREEYESARAALDRAKAIRPAAPEIESGLAQVAEGMRAKAIALHRERALELEARESWREALQEYEAALAIDGTLRFARDGKSRTASRALLAEKLDFQLSHPERLSDPRALEEASRLLDEASAIEPSGPGHQDSVRKLEANVASFSTPVAVQLLSDGFTEVTLYRVGALGKFDRRVIELRPGSYVVLGSRAGFRDVRLSFSIEAGKPAAPVTVRCEETI